MFLTASLFAQESVNMAIVEKIRNEGLKNSKVMDISFNITDVAGPRLSNSPGLKRAQDWAVQQMKDWGLKNVKLEAWGKFGKGWQVDKYYAATTLPFYRPIIASPKAWTPGTNGAIKSQVILIKADTVTDLQQYKGKLAGKIVMLDRATQIRPSDKPDIARTTDEQLAALAAAQPAAAGPAANRQRPAATAGNNQMAMMMRMREVAAAINTMLLEEKVGLLLTQARNSSYGTFFTSNGASYALDAKPVVPELEVSSEDYLHLHRLLKAGKTAEVEAEVKTTFYDKDPNGYNVIGEIPGTDPKLKDEIVMLGGHYDSWHAGTGATDNAAGSAVMMEAMRILKAIDFKPKRTIRIALWSSEEQGLHGSRNYMLAHFGDPATMVLKPDHEKLSAYYNLDNGTGKIRGIYLQGNEASRGIFQSWLTPFKDLGASTVTINNTGGTDHQAFDALGLPGYQFIQDPMDYSTRTHHSNMDTYERLDEDALKTSATIVASFVYNTSERAERMPRKELPKPRTPQTPPAGGAVRQ
ncbi:MAG: M20/M25/M40 family metallo-hydrolase [Chitinophagaceae bacterium]|nr:MAG: M20/M25/M40 family metallo-hydrolase [Chitinophagaceae bacterium]